GRSPSSPASPGARVHARGPGFSQRRHGADLHLLPPALRRHPGHRPQDGGGYDVSQGPDEYNEVEGISPDGKWTLVESSREQGGPERQNSRFIDIWKLALEPSRRDCVRLTRWGDYEGYKASNPVVSADGGRIGVQSARTT